MAVEGIDARVAARQVQSIGQRIVEIEHAQPYDLPGRQIQQRACLPLTVDSTQVCLRGPPRGAR